ncbi:MAG TPA: 8-oxoguanine deaminase [Roseiflexaceae bacterium]|nr:8-oxoguanine deaminase [Roseiflexaceae bacterium]
MPTLLLRHADCVVTMDAQRREIADGAVLITDGRIDAVGPTAELPAQADQVLDCRGMLLMPGLVNTHHHLYQSLTRAVPAAQDANLFGWLTTLYPIWAGMCGEDIYVSAKLGLAELLLSGCTTASDHLYLFPNGATLDDEIRAAQELGVRFHASRGSMSLGRSQGGLPPDSVVEDEAAILRDTRRVIETYHDPAPGAMLRIVVAPCSPFSVTPELMRESRELARSYGVACHTHLAETIDEEHFCLEHFGLRPFAYAEQLGWTGTDVWFAHSVHVDPTEITRMGATGTGAAHCPSSNMRLASGIAPVVAMLKAGVPVGLGVDGSASNDGGHLLGEARQAMLLQRVGGDPAALTARQALELATLGGARVLGRDDIGSLAPGMAADIVGWRLDRVAYAGALHDPVAALVFCQPQNVDLSVVNGRVRVSGGEIVGLDVPALVAEHNVRASALLRDA